MHAEHHLAAPSPAYLNFLAAVARLPLREAGPLALRLHIPSFAGDLEPAGALDTYLGYLKREATMHAVLFAGMGTVTGLSFDGNGPGSLAERDLDSLLAHLRRHFRFADRELADHEAVLDPGQAAPGRLARLRTLGFSRIRFDLDPGGADADLLAQLVPAARAAGFRSVSVALPYGAPEQGFDQLRAMLRAVVAAAPDCVLPRHRPGARREADAIVPGSVAQRMRQLCADHLDIARYTGRGVDGDIRHRKEGADDRWSGAERRREVAPGSHLGARLVGCGVGARAAFGALACRNVGALYDYYALLDRNELPVAQLFRREQTEPYLMQVKDFRDANQ